MSPRRALRATLASLTAAGLVLASAGCDRMRSGASPEVPLWAHRASGSIQVALRRGVTAPTRAMGEDYERGQPELDTSHRRVFVGSSDHGLYALRAVDGETIWRFETLGAVQCEPLYEPRENAVYFGSNDGALYKVRADDGTLVWRFATNSEVARRPRLDGGTLYVVNANDTLLALDPKTGEKRWSVHRAPALGMEVAGYAGPGFGDGKVYAAFSDGHVGAYAAADGAEKWLVDLSAEGEAAAGEGQRYLDVDTTPVFDVVRGRGTVYVAGHANGVFALDAETGARLWANDRATGVTELLLWSQPAHPPRDGVGPEVPARKILVASSGTTGLWGLAPDDGQRLWRRALPEGGISAPVPFVGALLVATTRYGLFLFSPLDGGAIDGVDVAGAISMTPAAHGRHAFVMNNAGALLGVHVDPPSAPPGK